MDTMLLDFSLRLLAPVVLVAVGGCNHLPNLGSINPFSYTNPSVPGVTDEVVVVESAPVTLGNHRMPPVTQPAALLRTDSKPTAVPSPMPLQVSMAPAALPADPANLGDLADSSQALVQRSRDPNQQDDMSLGEPVVLGDTQGVMDLPSTYWAVQIAAVKDIERVAEMVKEHQLQGVLGVPMNTQSGPLHAVLTGVYVKREDAVASVANLPPVLAGYEPWVRPLAHLQAAMR